MCVQIFHYRGPPCTCSLQRETLHTIVWLRGPTLKALPSSNWEPFCKAPRPSPLFAFPYTESPARLAACSWLFFPCFWPFPPTSNQLLSNPTPAPRPRAVSSRHCLHPGTQASLSCCPGGEASLPLCDIPPAGPSCALTGTTHPWAHSPCSQEDWATSPQQAGLQAN